MSSEYGLRLYPNLLKDCGWWQLTTPDQARMAKIAYVRLPQDFAYPAAWVDGYVVLDM